MTFAWPIALGTIAWAAVVLGGLAAVAYVLKMRRRRFEVPFSTLWQRVLREKEATSLWKRLRRLLSLLLTLFVLALLLLAAAEPRLGGDDRDARNVVILLDASASMKARDAGGEDDSGRERTRLAAAKDEVRRVLDGLGGGDAAMVMRMDGQTTPLSRFESDMPRLAKLVEGARASDTPADLRRALGAAADALRGRPNPMIVLVGDGAYDAEAMTSVTWKAGQPPLAPAAPAPAAPAAAPAPATPAAPAAALGARLDAIDLSGIDVRYHAVGSTGENVGIIAFNARRYATDKTSYEVYIEVQNFGTRPARRRLVLYNGNLATDARTLELNPGERLRQIYSRGGGEDSVLRASLDVEAVPGQASPPRRDVFPLDDQAWALLPARRKQHVLLVTTDNLYLEGAMLVYDNIEVDKLTPDEFDRAVADNSLPEYAAVVLDDHTPAQLPPPPTNLLYFHPQGDASPFKLKGRLSGPRITEVNENHPAMRWLVLADVNFDGSDVFGLDAARGDVALASSVRAPIIAARRGKDRKVVAAGFSLTGTDIMLRVAFPLFLVNTLDWFASDEADLLTTYATGARARVPFDGVAGTSSSASAAAEASARPGQPEVAITSPSGVETRAALVDGLLSFYADEVGIHTLRAREAGARGAPGKLVAELQLAANLSSPTESAIAPARSLSLGGKTLAAPDRAGLSHSRPIWLYLVLLAVLLLCAEWLTFNRRITI